MTARIIACGALAAELRDIIAVNRLDHVQLECLPASLHNTPQLICDAVERRVAAAKADGVTDILVGYADCGTAGGLDELCAAEGIERIDGPHCYSFLAGRDTFAAMSEADPTAFYLTDYLVRHFDRLVWAGLGLDRHPELRDAYFSNYRRVVYVAQCANVDDLDPALVRRAERAAERLGLTLELLPSGWGDLEADVVKRSVPVAITAGVS